MANPNLSEQDKWMAHPSLGVDASKFTPAQGGKAPAPDMGRPPVAKLTLAPIDPPRQPKSPLQLTEPRVGSSDSQSVGHPPAARLSLDPIDPPRQPPNAFQLTEPQIGSQDSPTMGRPSAPRLQLAPMDPPASTAPNSTARVKVVPGTWPPSAVDPLDPKPLRDATARRALYGDRVKDYLRSHKYTTDESGLVIGGKCADYGPVIRALRPLLNRALTDDDLTALIDAAAEEMHQESGKQLQPVPPAGAAAPGNAPVLQLAWNFSLGTAHLDTSTGKPSQEGAQYAAQVQSVIQLHPEGKPGFEVSPVANFTFDAKTHRILNGGAGGQVAWVESFFNGKVQLQAMVTAMIGAALTSQPTQGSVAISPVRMTQIAIGAQVLYSVPGLGNHLQVGFQIAPSVTQQGDAAPTLDFGPAAIVQVQW